MKTNEVLEILTRMFPEAHCELVHETPFQLAVAVVLSAQTTDEAVNRITPNLFTRYPSIMDLAEGELKDIEGYIKQIGLYHNKAKSIQGLAQGVMERFNGELPQSMELLQTLPGVGRKSANVILSVCFGVPAIAVDTHVERVSKRLGLAKMQDSILEVEKKLMRKIDSSEWSHAHHLFIFFGRYFCKARNPMCEQCPFIDLCQEAKHPYIKK